MNKIMSYCTVGAIAFLVDTCSFYLLFEELHLPFNQSRLLAFVIAASITWLGNRYWTFARSKNQSATYQYCKHMLSTSAALGLNLVICHLLLGIHWFKLYPVWAVASAIILTTLVNFRVSQSWVFLQPDKELTK